jgi:hypothetical protein
VLSSPPVRGFNTQTCCVHSVAVNRNPCMRGFYASKCCPCHL